MPLQATSGAASYDAFGGGVPVAVNYIEEVFSCFLYTGTGASQTITNGIDLSTKGGLVWIKDRTQGGLDYEHALTDTVRGATKELQSNSTAAQTTNAGGLTSFGSNGFSIGNSVRYNQNTDNYVSWTFREQPKFFDVVTFTTTTEPSSPVTISHNLGSTPGFVFIKNMSEGNDWYVYHRSLGNNAYLTLNTTDASTTLTGSWAVTSTTITIKDNFLAANSTFVVYLYAHDAGGFGLTGTDNVISCGSYTGNGSTTGPVVTLGYEPQWIIVKRASGGTGNWVIFDNMRGVATGGNDAILIPNLANGESSGSHLDFNATGFNLTSTSTAFNASSSDYIYITIRRGPMKVPTSGTSVFNPNAYSGTGADTTITSTGFAPDLFFSKARSFDSLYLNVMVDRLRGASQFLVPSNTIAETEGTNVVLSLNMNGVTLGDGSNANSGTVTYAQWNFKRAPSFFDEVCYTGTGSATTFSHNLGVVPELMIIKARSDAKNWGVYVAALGNGSFLNFNTTSASGSTTTLWNSTSPTSSVFTVGTALTTNESAQTYVAYLFATCAGVSKVGSYTGNGSTQTIDCGFTGGARFVLIKRTDSTGDWYVYDTARGMTVLTDPYLLVNSTAVEVATLGSVTTVSTGFALNSTILAAINVSSGTYIFLAIA
jgi:hypothetical protein